ncbi:hypothetical protein [Citrobacter sp. TSA-1]|uniref:hypothetical protein n=1 Tax=Citrobacter sp. TSA-1 TaxID=184912 RepID=UPI000BADEF4F|nr:hypothetical protein [Citrobacter sp. TSA-1]PAX79649.1 hypothetical protein CIK43_11605 [Citrobacter sp. TSA-1]QKE22104.1 hypothetical protein HF677_021405 [Citrobacter sp. TSA-1]
MMSWKKPSLEHPSAPKEPRWILWLLVMLIVGALGFGLSLYLSINGMLLPTISNTMLMIIFVICPALLVGFIRFFIYAIASYRHQLFTNMLDDAHREWQYWAGKHLGVLKHTRLTQIDEEQQDGISLSSLPPNKDNVLKLNSLKSLSSWEKQEAVIQKLLTPIAEYYHQHSLSQPITLYWQAEDNESNWQELIEQEAMRLSLVLGTVEMLPYKSFSEWLLALYKNTFEARLYAVLAIQSDSTSSEEAAGVLLAPQGFYESLRAPVQAKLLRPISTDLESFSEALKIQCEFQCSGEQLGRIWHCGINENAKGKCIESYARQNVPDLSEHIYDIDTLLGKGGIARHAVALSLICDYPHYNLMTYQYENSFLLQQIQM